MKWLNDTARAANLGRHLPRAAVGLILLLAVVGALPGEEVSKLCALFSNMQPADLLPPIPQVE